MDKIRELLEKLGSKELATQIIESFEGHEKTLRETLDKEYKARLDKAKEVCLEEVETYKNDLARKAQIFFESRADKIEQQIAKQVAIRESAAESKLKETKAILEDIEVEADNGQAKADLKALQDKVANLSKAIKSITEAKEQAELKANRAHEVAEKTLKRNRDLEKMLSEATEKKQEKVVEEGKKVVKEDKVIASKKGDSKTANVVSDVTVRKPVVKEVKTHSMAGYDPSAIADQLD